MAAGAGAGDADRRGRPQTLSPSGCKRGVARGIVETEIIKTLNELHNSQIHFRLGKDAKGCRINLCGPAL